MKKIKLKKNLTFTNKPDQSFDVPSRHHFNRCLQREILKIDHFQKVQISPSWFSRSIFRYVQKAIFTSGKSPFLRTPIMVAAIFLADSPRSRHPIAIVAPSREVFWKFEFSSFLQKIEKVYILKFSNLMKNKVFFNIFFEFYKRSLSKWFLKLFRSLQL